MKNSTQNRPGAGGSSVNVALGSAVKVGAAPVPLDYKQMNLWNRFWFVPASPYPMAAFRILFGIYLLWYFGRYVTRVTVMFSAQGVYSPYLIGDWALPPFAAYVAYLGLMVTISGFILGVRTRWVTPLLLLLYTYFYFLNLAVLNTSYDRLNLLLLITLCFADLDRVWSIRPRSLPGSNNQLTASVWSARLIVIQVCLLYFGSGLWKLLNPAWQSGDLLRWTLIGPWGNSLSFWLVSTVHSPWVYNLLTWGVIGFELAFPFVAFLSPLRRYAFILGVIFHVANASLLNVPEFLNCITTYVLFMQSEVVERTGNALFAQLSGVFCRFSRERS